MTNTLSATDKRSKSLRVRFTITDNDLGMEYFYAVLSDLPNDAARTQQVRRWLYESRDSLQSLHTHRPVTHRAKPLSMPAKPLEGGLMEVNSISQPLAEPAPPARRRTSLDALARMGLTVTSNLIP